MTNREYLNTLTEEELATYIYDGIVEKIGRRYNSSVLGVTDWLLRKHTEADDIENMCYIKR